MTSPTEEISIETAFKKFLTDEKLCNVTLRGTDGKLVRGNRHALASRSEYFYKLLLGDFKETSEDVVDIGFKGDVLQAIVEYICTNTVSLLAQPLRLADGNGNGNGNSNAMVDLIVELVRAAMVFGLTKLLDHVQKYCVHWTQGKPEMTFYVWTALHESGIEANIIKENALKLVRPSPAQILQGQPFFDLGSFSLEAILCDDEMNMTELERFGLLKDWVDNQQKEIEKTQILQLTSLIKLDCIKPKDLTDIVAPSKMVTESQLLAAFRAQALRSGHNDVELMQYRCSYSWEGSQNAVLSSAGWKSSKLACPPMKDGIWKFSIKVERGGGICLGVVSASISTPDGCWYSGAQGVWTHLPSVTNHYGPLDVSGGGSTFGSFGTSGGEAFRFGVGGDHFGSSEAPGGGGFVFGGGRGDLSFPNGSVVEFTLDTEAGTLSVSVDGNASTNLHANIPPEDLVPAASVRVSSVRLVRVWRP